MGKGDSRRETPFSKGNNNKILNIHSRKLKISPEPLGHFNQNTTKHSWLKDTQGPCPFQMGDNNEMAKIH